MLSLIGGVLKDGCLGKAGAGDVFAHHVVDRDGVGGRLDAFDVEAAEALGVAENGVQLRLEGRAFLVAQFEPGEAGDVADVDMFGGHRAGSKGDEAASGKRWKALQGRACQVGRAC